MSLILNLFKVENEMPQVMDFYVFVAKDESAILVELNLDAGRYFRVLPGNERIAETELKAKYIYWFYVPWFMDLENNYGKVL